MQTRASNTALVHFPIMKLITFLAYCVDGLLILGRRNWDFSLLPVTISNASAQCTVFSTEANSVP